MNNTVFHFDVPHNEPMRVLRARLAGARAHQGRARPPGGDRDRDPAHHRRQGGPHRQDRQGGDALRPPATCWRPTTRPPRRRWRWPSRRRSHAKKQWEALSWVERASITLKAADLLSRKHRDLINAATMLGQGKNVYQAEIDAACETIDFLRYNAYFASQIYADQPRSRLRPAQPHGVPAARGLRLHGEPVQLHRHRLEPQHVGGADGQHHGVEAGDDLAAVELLPDEGLPGGRACPTA